MAPPPAPGDDQVIDIVGKWQQFGDCKAAAIAGVRARRTPFGSGDANLVAILPSGSEQQGFFLAGQAPVAAMGAQAPHQTLGKDKDDLPGQQRRAKPQIDKTGNRTKGVGGVKCRQNPVAGHCRAHCHAGGFLVAHLANQQHVRVLPQDGADAIGIGHVARPPQIALSHPGQFIFDRLFQRHDVEFGGVERAEQCIERGGLAAAGRSGDNHDALRPRDQPLQRRHHGIAQTQRADVEQSARTVEDAQDKVFAVDGRVDRGAEIDISPGNGQREPAILGAIAFGNVHARHDLQAGDDCRPVVGMQAADLDQYTVDAIAQAHERAFRLEMKVGCPALDGIDQQRVHELRDRPVVVDAFAFGVGRVPVLHRAGIEARVLVTLAKAGCGEGVGVMGKVVPRTRFRRALLRGQVGFDAAKQAVNRHLIAMDAVQSGD